MLQKISIVMNLDFANLDETALVNDQGKIVGGKWSWDWKPGHEQPVCSECGDIEHMNFQCRGYSPSWAMIELAKGNQVEMEEGIYFTREEIKDEILLQTV